MVDDHHRPTGNIANTGDFQGQNHQLGPIYVDLLKMLEIGNNGSVTKALEKRFLPGQGEADWIKGPA